MTDYDTAYFNYLSNSVSAGLRDFCKWFERVTYRDGITSHDIRSKLYELVPQLDEFLSVAAERLEAARALSKND